MTMETDAYYGAVRPEIVAMVPVTCKTVLDVGCGSGATGRRLKEKGVNEVWGIERNARAADKARQALDHVIEGDIEALDLPFESGYFDCIICADVLEHLLNPWGVVGKLKKFLKPQGVIVASIPNIGFHRIVRGLIRGHWQYSDAGILDRTHLRFFTLQGIEELFSSNSMEIDKVYRKIDSGANMKILNLLCANRIRESLVIQYVIRARIR